MPEVLSAISKVKAECNKVAAMSLFQVPITKSMRLEEFEQAQGQATAQVFTYFLTVSRHYSLTIKK